MAAFLRLGACGGVRIQSVPVTVRVLVPGVTV